MAGITTRSVRNDPAQLSELIGDIYDAALDPTQWINVLARTAPFVGGPAASLYSKDMASKTGNVAYQFGLDPQYVQLFFDTYMKFDPTSIGYFIADIEEPVSTADVIPYDEFLETRFYKEWAQPQGLVDTAHALLDKSATGAAAFVVFRHERNGLVDEEARWRMRLIVPHIRRAALIGKVLDLRKAEAASLADTLDGISAGVILVDAAGRIVHANAAANVMLSNADVLRATGGRLISNDPQTDKTLADTFATVDNGDAAMGIKGIAVPLTARTGQRYVAHVLPLTSGARERAGTRYAAAAALFVHKATPTTPSAPEAIAKAYKLTPTELRVLLAVAGVGGVSEVANALGVSAETVKTHLSRVFQKTRSKRQADLVRIVGSFANPLVR
jgi:DNA-binding CsgD family transcriptional regulator/PAS domain-containing protein